MNVMRYVTQEQELVFKLGMIVYFSSMFDGL